MFAISKDFLSTPAKDPSAIISWMAVSYLCCFWSTVWVINTLTSDDQSQRLYPAVHEHPNDTAEDSTEESPIFPPIHLNDKMEEPHDTNDDTISNSRHAHRRHAHRRHVPEQHDENITFPMVAISETKRVAGILFERIKISQDLLRDLVQMHFISWLLSKDDDIVIAITLWLFMFFSITSVLSNNTGVDDDDQATTDLHKIAKASCALLAMFMIIFTGYQVFA